MSLPYNRSGKCKGKTQGLLPSLSFLSKDPTSLSRGLMNPIILVGLSCSLSCKRALRASLILVTI